MDIAHLARLAQLALTPEEQAGVRADLTQIMAMVDTMQGIATDNVEPLAHPLGTAARLRADVAIAGIDRDVVQALAPETQDGLYLVPRVVE